jgi:altronate dehydratase
MERGDRALSFTLNEIKLAVINRDLEKLKEISIKKPLFSSIQEAQEIESYIKKAIEILNEEKSKISKEMREIKKLQKFQTQKNSSSFDFKG